MKKLALAVAITASVVALPASADYTGKADGKAGQSVSAYALLSNAAKHYYSNYDSVRLSGSQKIEGACNLGGPTELRQAESEYWQQLKAAAPQVSRRVACDALVVEQAQLPFSYYADRQKWSSEAYMLARVDYSIAVAQVFGSAAKELTQHAYTNISAAQRAARRVFVETAHAGNMGAVLNSNADYIRAHLTLAQGSDIPAANVGPYRAVGGDAGLTLTRGGVPYYDPASGTLSGVDYKVDVTASRSMHRVVHNEPQSHSSKQAASAPTKINIFGQ